MNKEDKVNKIGKDIYECISGVPFDEGLAILTTNMVGLLITGINNKVWTKEEAVRLVNRLNYSIEDILDNSFDMNQC